MPLIAPSILSADFGRLREEIQEVEAAGADWIHVDVMDGHFVPNITLGPIIVKAARQTTTLPLDVHLMIESPDRYIGAFAEAGADLIAVQVEACIHLHRSIHFIKDLGKKAGAVLNPATPISALDWILADLDFVLIMSVNPGFGGQKFIQSSLDKIKTLRKMIHEQGLSTLIEVDGGINRATVGKVIEAGADVLVAGSAIFGSTDYYGAIQTLKMHKERLQ